jgi:hypothetical protein
VDFYPAHLLEKGESASLLVHRVKIHQGLQLAGKDGKVPKRIHTFDIILDKISSAYGWFCDKFSFRERETVFAEILLQLPGMNMKCD